MDTVKTDEPALLIEDAALAVLMDDPWPAGLRLFEAAGAELARNDRWLGLAVLAASVSAIDGVPVPLPATKAAIEAAVARLDEAGLAAVAAALSPAPVLDRTLAGN